MRCDCCQRNLNDYESTLKSATTGEYLNTCGKCLDGLNIETIGRQDLNPNEEQYDDDCGEDGELTKEDYEDLFGDADYE